MQQPVGGWTARWVHDAWPVAENIVRERREIAAGASILMHGCLFASLSTQRRGRRPPMLQSHFHRTGLCLRTLSASVGKLLSVRNCCWCVNYSA
jgi:hypothetical protein